MANIITENEICIFEVDKYLNDFSDTLQKLLNKDFADYGIKLNKFFVTTILKPEDDKQYLEFKELYFKQTVSVAEAELRQKVNLIDEETKAKQKVIASEAEAKKRAQEGYSYQEERSYNALEKMAANEGVGEFANVGVGLGIMSGIGTTLGDKVGNNVQGVIANIDNSTKTCPKCGTANSKDHSFCKKCGTSLENNLTCPNCHHKLEPDNIFCPKCGRRIK